MHAAGKDLRRGSGATNELERLPPAGGKEEQADLVVVVDTEEEPGSAGAEAAGLPPAAAAPPAGGRRPWTRDRVVSELAQWLLEEPGVDAALLSRRGQAPLANWARRLFGRFDAALNAANLHLAQLYPDGPPTRRRAPLAA